MAYIAKHSNLWFKYNIKFKSSLWDFIPKFISPCVQAYSQLYCVISGTQQTHFYIAIISYPHHYPIFQCIYFHTHTTNSFFLYTYSMSESHTWDVVCEWLRDPYYISTSRSPKDGRDHHNRCTKGSRRKGMRLMGSGRSGLVGIGRWWFEG